MEGDMHAVTHPLDAGHPRQGVAGTDFSYPTRRNTGNRGKIPANQGIAVRKHQDGENDVVCTCSRIEGQVNLTVRQEAGIVIADQPVHRCEVTANQDFATLLYGDSVYRAVSSRADVERSVKRPIDVQANDVNGSTG